MLITALQVVAPFLLGTVMLLPSATQQAAGTLARRLSCLSSHAVHRGEWSRTRCCNHAASSISSSSISISSSSSSPAATAMLPAAADQEQQNLPHVSVLLQEVLHNLNHMPIKVYVDCTLGAGGHMEGMMQQHPVSLQQQQQQVARESSSLAADQQHALVRAYAGLPASLQGLLGNSRQAAGRQEMQVGVGIDVDPVAHSIAAARLAPLCSRPGGPTLHQLRGNYSDVLSLLSSCAADGGPLVGRVDAMLMDLGVSSMQLDSAGRGFSFVADGPIDMRMDPGAGLSAEELVNAAPESELCRILRDYGEEKSWRAVARRIVAAREAGPIKTTQQLVQVVGQTQLRGSSGGKRRGGGPGRGIHPATRTFQALRIAVNDEIVRLEQALPAAISCLSPGGRLAVISFHSLEDRAVKHAFMSAAGRPTPEQVRLQGRAAGRPTPEQEALVSGPDGWRVLDSLAAAAQGSLVTRKPLLAGPAEVAANARSRSAKLRVFEKAGGPAAGSSGRSSKRRQRDAK
ncbi:MraW methylase family-domain-containing protein [Scenedesmus sp. NREL 46B-D3]|nr:MraW methylase family-domain-containing protein [Scenedesmus sp. NREL 46B-D3]